MNNPLISVIIPVFNNDTFLNRCIDSVLFQTYKNLEIILVDDGSTDNSGKICDNYAKQDSRIKVIHKQNGGVSSARNAALFIAKGEYIGFIDSDDYIDANMYEYLLELCKIYKTDISVCNFFTIYKGKKEIKLPKNIKPLLSGKEAIEAFDNSSFVCNKLFSKKLFESCRFKEDISYGEDKLLLVPMLFRINGVAYGPYGKYFYVVNDNGCTEKFTTKSLSYFKVLDSLRAFADENKMPSLCKKLKLQRVSFAVRSLKQILESNYEDTNIIEQLCREIKENIFNYLMTSDTLLRKFFALSICISCNFTKKIYLLLQRGK